MPLFIFEPHTHTQTHHAARSPISRSLKGFFVVCRPDAEHCWCWCEADRTHLMLSIDASTGEREKEADFQVKTLSVLGVAKDLPPMPFGYVAIWLCHFCDPLPFVPACQCPTDARGQAPHSCTTLSSTPLPFVVVSFFFVKACTSGTWHSRIQRTFQTQPEQPLDSHVNTVSSTIPLGIRDPNLTWGCISLHFSHQWPLAHQANAKHWCPLGLGRLAEIWKLQLLDLSMQLLRDGGNNNQHTCITPWRVIWVKPWPAPEQNGKKFNVFAKMLRGLW